MTDGNVTAVEKAGGAGREEADGRTGQEASVKVGGTLLITRAHQPSSRTRTQDAYAYEHPVLSFLSARRLGGTTRPQVSDVRAGDRN